MVSTPPPQVVFQHGVRKTANGTLPGNPESRMKIYQQIFSMGISALQQLSKEVEILKSENKNLRMQNTELYQSLGDIRAKVELLEKKMEQNQTLKILK